MRRPLKLKWISIDNWNAMTEDEQRLKCEEAGVQTSASIREALNQTSTTPMQRIVTTPVPANKTNAAAASVAHAEPVSAPKLYGLRNWTESVEIRGKGVYAGSRIKECILYLIDVKKDPWYMMNLSKGFIMAKADKLDADTPDDAYLYLGNNPLFGLKKFRDDDYETVINEVLRYPESEEERHIIKQKLGVTPGTFKWLVKKDCPKCKGTGKYDVSSYPGNALLERLEESIECECAYE
jgi:hypothetical protein